MFGVLRRVSVFGVPPVCQCWLRLGAAVHRAKECPALMKGPLCREWVSGEVVAEAAVAKAPWVALAPPLRRDLWENTCELALSN